MALNAMQVEKAQPKEKPYKLSDGGGLYLHVNTKGGRWWRFKYRFNGKEKLISLGIYPDISLKEARDRRQEARSLVATGIDPSANKKATKAVKAEVEANTFEAIAREWHRHMVGKKAWKPDHAAKIMKQFERDLFPWIGSKPITEVAAKDLKGVLDRIRARGVVETARRALTIMGQVYRYAIQTDRANYDVSVGFKSYLPSISKTRKHMASVTDPKELAPLLRAMDGYEGTLMTQCALKLLPLLFVRPGNLRHMEWSEIDLDAGEWTIPAQKMKMNTPHLVPLSRQAVEILKEIQPLTGGGRYVFPSVRSKTRCISNNTINAGFRRLGFDAETVTGHGFRATARTILDEVLRQRPDIIEHQLSHAVRDPNGRAYNRTSYLSERRKLMQLWSDYLDGLKMGAKVLPLRREA